MAPGRTAVSIGGLMGGKGGAPSMEKGKRRGTLLCVRERKVWNWKGGLINFGGTCTPGQQSLTHVRGEEAGVRRIFVQCRDRRKKGTGRACKGTPRERPASQGLFLKRGRHLLGSRRLPREERLEGKGKVWGSLLVQRRAKKKGYRQEKEKEILSFMQVADEEERK